MARFNMPKFKSPVKTASPKIRTKTPRVSKVRTKISSKISSKSGHSIKAKDLTHKQAKSLLKLQTKYELARAKAGIMSEAAMKHHENMAKIKGRTATNISAMTQAAGSATTLGGTALLREREPAPTAQVQVNGGMSNATQGRNPSSNSTTNSQNGESQTNSSNGQQWSDIIDQIGKQ